MRVSLLSDIILRFLLLFLLRPSMFGPRARIRLFISGFKLFIAVYSCFKPKSGPSPIQSHLHFRILDKRLKKNPTKIPIKRFNNKKIKFNSIEIDKLNS